MSAAPTTRCFIWPSEEAPATQRHIRKERLDELAQGAFVPIAGAMPAMLWIGDPDGRCVYRNKAQRDFRGVETGEAPRFAPNGTSMGMVGVNTDVAPEDQAPGPPDRNLSHGRPFVHPCRGTRRRAPWA